MEPKETFFLSFRLETLPMQVSGDWDSIRYTYWSLAQATVLSRDTHFSDFTICDVLGNFLPIDELLKDIK